MKNENTFFENLGFIAYVIVVAATIYSLLFA